MKAVVLGGALSVWDDLRTAGALFAPDMVATVNHIGEVYPGSIDCWVSYHFDLMPAWIRTRAVNGLPAAKELWTCSKTRSPPKGINMLRLSNNKMGGSSGLLAIDVLRHRGATKIVLCGVPMDPAMRHFHDRQGGKPWKEADLHFHHWIARASELREITRSVSGRTAELLGRPDDEWLTT